MRQAGGAGAGGGGGGGTGTLMAQVSAPTSEKAAPVEKEKKRQARDDE